MSVYSLLVVKVGNYNTPIEFGAHWQYYSEAYLMFNSKRKLHLKKDKKNTTDELTHGYTEEIIFENNLFCLWQLRQAELTLIGNAAIVSRKIKALFLLNELIIVTNLELSFTQN